MKSTKDFLKTYVKFRPLFLGLIRSREASLWQKYLPLKGISLDLGCGDGLFAKIVFGKVSIGLDVADSRMGQVEKGIYDKLVTYDGHKIPLNSKSVDVVVSNCVLEHIPNIDEVIGEVNRILKPGGKFITSVLAHPWEENLAGAMVMGNAYKAWMKKKQVHFNLLNNKDWADKFKIAGFKVNEEIGYLSKHACRTLDIAHYFSVPYLISYIVFKKWVVYEPMTNIWPTEKLAKIMDENVEPNKAGALFFVLQKK